MQLKTCSYRTVAVLRVFRLGDNLLQPILLGQISMKQDKTTFSSGASHSSQSNPTAKSDRKQIRKQKRLDAKANRRSYFQRRIPEQPAQRPFARVKPIASKDKETLKPKKGKKEEEKQFTQDDRIIESYEQKLSLGNSKQKYSKIAKGFGYDDDLFDFLDGISAKVKESVPPTNKQQQKKKAISPSNPVQLEENQQFDAEYNQMFNELAEQPVNQVAQVLTNQQNLAEERNVIRKGMNGFFNKLSDGNILITFRQFIQMFRDHPRSLTIQIFCTLFIKFNLRIEKPIFHVFTANVALCAGLQQSLGNRLMAPLIYELAHQFLKLEKEQQNEEEIREIGYSRVFEKRKNFVQMVGLFFQFEILNGQFIESLVEHLSKSLSKYNTELLYILIDKCGAKIRNSDPSIFKKVLESVKTSVSQYKSGDQDQTKKIAMIEKELNEIRFNKKSLLNEDQRMGFLHTFLKKNVPKETVSCREMFTLRLEDVLSADVSRTNWWDQSEMMEVDEEMDQDVLVASRQNKELVELARSFHLVTEAKRNIFIELMDSKDYVQATQRILELKVKNIQDIATVLVEVCTLEPNFNPYYVMVAAKLASLNPKFRLNLQFALWDHIKLVEEYELRRTVSLAKFMARLIAHPISNCSISMIKCFHDLGNLQPVETVFVNIFFKEFFRKVKKDQLSKVIAKLREENNRDVKENLKEFLVDFVREEREQPYVDKIQICRKLLLIEISERQQETLWTS